MRSSRTLPGHGSAASRARPALESAFGADVALDRARAWSARCGPMSPRRSRSGGSVIVKTSSRWNRDRDGKRPRCTRSRSGACVAATTRTSRAWRAGRADAANGVAVERTEELRLRVERQISDLVEEERAALGLLEGAAASRVRARERALLVAEELALDELARDARHVDRDERLVLARRERVERLRDELLAAARSRRRRARDSAYGASLRTCDATRRIGERAADDAGRGDRTLGLRVDWETHARSVIVERPSVTIVPAFALASRDAQRADVGAVLRAGVAHDHALFVDVEHEVERADGLVGDDDRALRRRCRPRSDRAEAGSRGCSRRLGLRR